MFYFSDAEAAIPLCFELRNDSLAVSVPLKEIEENGTKKIIDISVLPYLCACPNSNDKSSYILFPSGSGALMYTDEEKTGNSRSITADVYGVDYGRRQLDHTYDAENVRLPVFGVKYGDKALFSIIEAGDGAAEITADAGNTRNGYSAVYPTFHLRSYDETETVRNDYSDERIYAEGFDTDLTYLIGYYPLKNENADYVGMANCYRKYLKLSDEDKNEQAAIRLNFMGGDRTKHFFMGVPYMALTPATTFDDVIDLSKGCIELLYKEIWDRCPTAIVTVGNHEYLQQMQGNVPESIPASERWQMLQDNWKHDIYYYSEVMNDKVMLIQLNNGERKFYESQIEPLENDLKLAREKGYTVLLFCHETIITNNPAMASVNAIRGNDMSAATNQNFYTNESRAHVGGSDADEATKAVCNLIYGNGDIIKGVFNGHYHSDFYTEILGTSPSGGTYMIPQYTLTGSAYDSGHVLKITVK